MKVTIKYRAVLFFMILFQIMSAQEVEYEQYTMKDGLPSMQTYEILQDSFGLLWIGTENGLVSYDGDEFVRYSHPELLDNDIIEISLNRNGRIYFVNLSGQLAYLENNEILLVSLPKPKIHIQNIISKAEKDYVTIRNVGRTIYELIEQPDKIFEIKETNYNFFDAIEEDYFKGSKKDVLLNSKGEVTKIIDRAFFQSDKANYVIDDLIFRTELFQVDTFLFDYLQKHRYRRFTMYNDDAFIIDHKGVKYYNAQSNEVHPFLTNLAINTVFRDSENNTWISTPDKGLLNIPNLNYETSKSKNTFTTTGINDIIQDKNGNIYLGTVFSDIIINPQTSQKYYNLNENQRPIQFYDFDQEMIAYNEYSFSTLNINTLNFSLVSDSPNSLKSLLILDSLAYTCTSHHLQVHPKEYLFDGKFIYNDTSIIDARIACIHNQASSNTIYLGTSRGLYQGKGTTFELVKNKSLQTINFSKITGGDENTIWAASSNKGLLKIKNDTILKRYNTSNGLVSNNITNLEKNENELMISKTLGLCILDLTTDQIRVINEFNFLPTSEVLVCKIIDGKYWIGTSEGLTILSREDVLGSGSTKSILSLSDFIVNAVRMDYTPNMSLSHSENNIQLNLQHISFKSKKDKYIKYRIPVIDTTWITTKDKNIRLPSLNSGRYHVEVKGINSIGLESDPLDVYFRIDQAWWNISWVRLLGFLLTIGIGTAIFINRARRIRRTEKTKREYLSQINKIKDQALQLQMNPHFIFNSLNAIQGFIGTDEEEKAMNYLARFARLIRLIFEHSKDNTITLEEELEFIQLYLDLEKLRFKDKVAIEMVINDEIQEMKDIIKVPPLLIQPIVENSFKHGLFHKKGKGHLKLKYTLIEGYLKVIIEDDGIGRVMSKKFSKKKVESMTSSGIGNTRERIELLNFNKKDNLNSVEIEDLYHTNGSAAGTRTIILLCLNSNDINQ